MTDPLVENEEEKPLDPAAERLRAKMMRLMVVSVGTMFIGIFAVLFAIVYKMNNAADAQTTIEARVELPSGFTIEETQLSDGILLFRGETNDGAQRIFMFDAQTGSKRGTIDIQ